MKLISQRELRNDNAQIVRNVELGQTYIVTRRGVPIAQIGPIDQDTDLRCLTPAKKRLDPGELHLITSTQPTAEVLDKLRSDR